MEKLYYEIEFKQYIKRRNILEYKVDASVNLLWKEVLHE